MIANWLLCLIFALAIHGASGQAMAADNEVQLDEAALAELAFALESMFNGHKGAVEVPHVRSSHAAPLDAATSSGSYFLIEFSYSNDCAAQVSNYTYVVTDTCVPLTLNSGALSVGVKFACDGTTGLTAAAYLSTKCCGTAILSSSYYSYADGTCVKDAYGRKSGTKYQCTSTLPFTASCPISLYFAKSGTSGSCTYPSAVTAFRENTCVDTNSTSSGYELYQEVTCDSSSKNLTISEYLGTCNTTLGGVNVFDETIAGGTCKYDSTGIFSGVKPDFSYGGSTYLGDGAYYTIAASSQSKITCTTTTNSSTTTTSSATSVRRSWLTHVVVIAGVLLFGFRL